MNNIIFNNGLKKLYLVFVTISVLLFSLITGCDKNDDPDFTAAFTYSFIDDNNVKFENASSGDYHSLTWDFGNGESETTSDKKKTYQVYYPTAGDYKVSLRLTNYSGSNKTSEQTITIASDDLTVNLSFTIEEDPNNPNILILTNTSQGQYDSFEWRYQSTVIENEVVHQAYFPFAGDYEIELVALKNDQELSISETITIVQDDPNYNPNLIWSDEFDYTGLPDDTYWNMETGGGGWGNNELQYYTDREENAMVANGVLTITALEESYGSRDYTSARITTQNKFDFKYGKIEARIKLPYGQGIWPAFWMLGDNISSVGWPACGEIDIMEMVGGDNNRDNTSHSTLHWDQNGSHADYGESYTLPSGIFADDFHVFAVEWDSQEIRGYVDDIQFFTADITPDQLSEFHDNFFIIMNVAVGGNWPGSPNSSTTFPQTMEVDYVRVYELD